MSLVSLEAEVPVGSLIFSSSSCKSLLMRLDMPGCLTPVIAGVASFSFLCSYSVLFCLWYFSFSSEVALSNSTVDFSSGKALKYPPVRSKIPYGQPSFCVCTPQIYAYIRIYREPRAIMHDIDGDIFWHHNLPGYRAHYCQYSTINTSDFAAAI